MLGKIFSPPAVAVQSDFLDAGEVSSDDEGDFNDSNMAGPYHPAKGPDHGLSPLTVTYEIFRANTRMKRTFSFDLALERIAQNTGSYPTSYILCSNIVEATVIGHHNLLIEFRKRGLQTKKKFIKFSSAKKASAFKYYIDYIQQFGEFVRKAFQAIDTGELGYIDAVNLYAVLRRLDVTVLESDISMMISYANYNNSKILKEKRRKAAMVDYTAFFNLFVQSHVKSLTEFVSEWIKQTRTFETSKAMDTLVDSSTVTASEDDSSISTSCLSPSSSAKPPLLAGTAGGMPKKSSLSLLPGEQIVREEVSNVRWCIGSCSHALSSHAHGHVNYGLPNSANTAIPTASSQPVFSKLPSIWDNSCVLGKMIVTNFRVLLISNNVKSTSTFKSDGDAEQNEHSRYSADEFHSQLSIPLINISQLRMVPNVPTVLVAVANSSLFSGASSKNLTSNNMVSNAPNIVSLMALLIVCKDCRVVKILLPAANLSAPISLGEEDAAAGPASPGSPAKSPKSPGNRGQSMAAWNMAARPQTRFSLTPAPAREVVENNIQLEDTYNCLQRMCFPKLCFNQLTDVLFAFRYRMRFSENGWDLSNMLKEYVRQGLVSSPYWKVYDNSEYSLCTSYPSHIVVPATMTNDDVHAVGAHRSRQRIPAVTYRHASSGAVLARAAQPKTGVLTRIQCNEDVDILNSFRLSPCATLPEDPRNRNDPFIAADPGSCHDGSLTCPKKHYIIDCRSFLAATANKALGKGTEDLTSYQNTQIIYCNIDNIHAMRASLSAVGDLLSPGGYDDNIHGDYYFRLNETGWLRHIRCIICAGVAVAEKIHLEACSVTAHCSDGWDRTAQVVCIAQLILEPYYRTIEGFAVLIEKDWCAFGHKFHDRCGHGEVHNSGAEERSPVFLQFLDAVMQMTVQFPTAFQFNSSLLVFIADHTFSGLFGNFIGNSDMERRQEYKVMTATQSIWSYVYEYSDRFLNDDYEAYDKCIWASGSIRQLVLWKRYFCRWDSDAIPKAIYVGDEWHDDW